MLNIFGQHTSEFVLEDSVHIILFYIILATFYFYHVSKDEEKDIFHILQDTTQLNPHNNKVTESEKRISEVLQKTYNTTWDEVKANALEKYQARISQNKSLIWKTVGAGLAITVILIGLNIFVIYRTPVRQRPSFTDSLKETIITVIILATIEILFFFLVVNKYKHISREEIIFNLFLPYSGKEVTH